MSLNKFGGAKRDRTADLYNAIVALSQLSYSPFLLSKTCLTAETDQKPTAPSRGAKQILNATVT